MNAGWSLLLALVLFVPPQAGADEEDWGQLRRDVESSQRDARMEAHRQAMRARAHSHFVEADTDNSGGLDRREVSRMRGGLRQNFDLIDGDGDGQITERELAQAWKMQRATRRPPPPRPLPPPQPPR